jgi:hypothetical protein
MFIDTMKAPFKVRFVETPTSVPSLSQNSRLLVERRNGRISKLSGVPLLEGDDRVEGDNESKEPVVPDPITAQEQVDLNDRLIGILNKAVDGVLEPDQLAGVTFHLTPSRRVGRVSVAGLEVDSDSVDKVRGLLEVDPVQRKDKPKLTWRERRWVNRVIEEDNPHPGDFFYPFRTRPYLFELSRKDQRRYYKLTGRSSAPTPDDYSRLEHPDTLMNEMMIERMVTGKQLPPDYDPKVMAVFDPDVRGLRSANSVMAKAAVQATLARAAYRDYSDEELKEGLASMIFKPD